MHFFRHKGPLLFLIFPPKEEDHCFMAFFLSYNLPTLVDGSLFSDFIPCQELLLSVSDWEWNWGWLPTGHAERPGAKQGLWWLYLTPVWGKGICFQDEDEVTFSVSNKSLYFDIRTHCVCFLCQLESHCFCTVHNCQDFVLHSRVTGLQENCDRL